MRASASCSGRLVDFMRRGGAFPCVATIDDAVRDHYVARWNKPSSTFWFDYPEGYRIWVYKWNPNPTPETLTFYATLGASRHPMEGGRNPSHRIEVFIGLSSDHDDIAGHLASLADYPARNRTSLDHTHMVPGDEPLWKGTQMCDVLLIAADEVISPLVLPDKVHVHFLEAVPLYRSELDFKRGHSWEEFYKRMGSFDSWDADRAPRITDE